jgi:hypothetical protein
MTGSIKAMIMLCHFNAISIDENNLNITQVNYVSCTYIFHITPWF